MNLIIIKKKMSFEYLQEVTDDYETLLKTEIRYDVIIYAGENENVKEIHAHSIVLRTRSQYFCGAFSNKWVKKENGKFIFKKPNISPHLFKIILRFIYCGKIDLDELQIPEILKLLIAVDELNIQTLITCIQEYLIENHDKFLQQNLTEILQIVYQYGLFTDLLNYCFEKASILFNSDEFINLESPLLEFFLKHNDLNIDEIEIWEILIKWGLAQEQGLNQDVYKWNQHDINTIREILHKFIPLIRFYGISSEDYHNKVKPYEEILPKELQIDALKFHMSSGQNLLPRYFVDSVLINRKHIMLFSNWIVRKEESTKHITTSYKYNLLYRASRDGNTATAFHEKCDNKGATIVVAKVKNLEQILGGYNPLFWDKSSSWKPTKDSFIFSFSNRNKLQTAKISYINDQYHEFSVYCSHAYGPTFGRGFDLSFQFDNTSESVSYNNSRSYSKIGIPLHYKVNSYDAFRVEDYEVFQVIKIGS